MDIENIEALENFFAYQNTPKESLGYDLLGREYKNMTHIPDLSLSIYLAMSRPDKTTAEINGSWDESHGARIEGKITWEWGESKDDSKNEAPQNKEDRDTSCRDADSKDRPE